MKKLLKKLLPLMRHSVLETVIYTGMTFTLIQLIIINIMLKDWGDVFHFVTFSVLFAMYVAVQIILKKVMRFSDSQQGVINAISKENEALQAQNAALQRMTRKHEK